MISMSRLGAIVFGVLLCGAVLPAHAQTAAGKKCAPVTPKTPQEALMMETASGKKGCWVRMSDGSLVFISELAPDKNYPPLRKSPAAQKAPSPAVKQPSGALPHGPTNPALYPLLAGTWEGTFCGLKTDSMRLSAAGSILSGTIKGYNVAMNQECDATQGDICLNSSPTHNTPTCESLEPRIIDETPIQASLVNGGFDGHILWFSVAVEGQTREVQWQFSGNKLILDDQEKPPTIYRKVQ